MWLVNPPIDVNSSVNEKLNVGYIVRSLFPLVSFPVVREGDH